MAKIFFISGIDTDIGKSLATGLIGRYLVGMGKQVISQKIVQTGCEGIAEDIITHRQIMERDLLPEDYNGDTCPYVFSRACSPHLAARLEGRKMNPQTIKLATERLAKHYDYVLIEGAGGLMVPLTANYTQLDYLEEQKKSLTLILVSSSRLGSINHTLSALELVKNRGLNVAGIIYNRFGEEDKIIGDDSKRIFSDFLQRYGYRDCVIELPAFETTKAAAIDLDFGELIEEQ